MKGDVHCLCCPRRHHIPQNYGTEVKLVMMVFNASHGILRWSAYFALHFWRLRLKSAGLAHNLHYYKDYAPLQAKITYI